MLTRITTGSVFLFFLTALNDGNGCRFCRTARQMVA